MNKEVEKIYKRKIKEFQKHNKLYYDKSAPAISDREFDELKADIINLEKKYSFLRSTKSPSDSVGFKPSKNFEKFKHKVQMLSLSNAFDREDLINFEKKILNYLNEKISLEYSVEPKIDGISASLTYLNGNLTYGVSRGDGSEGELADSAIALDWLQNQIRALEENTSSCRQKETWHSMASFGSNRNFTGLPVCVPSC